MVFIARSSTNKCTRYTLLLTYEKSHVLSGVWDANIHHVTLVIWHDISIEDWVLSVEMTQMSILDARKTFEIP